MQTIERDVAIIGAGTAGLNARRAALREGASVVMIEAGPHGTTCARVGCMPSKLLIRAAEAAHEVAHAGTYGIDVDGYSVDAQKVFERVRSERDRFVGFVLEAVDHIPDDQKLSGRATLVSDHIVEVGDHTRVHAKTVVIATGSSPFVPPQLRPLEDRLLGNDDIFEIETLPKSLAVFGMGVIALEVGQALHRLGVEVTFFSIDDRIGPISDPIVLHKAHEVFGRELRMFAGADIHEVEAHGERGVRVRWTCHRQTTHQEDFDAVFVATGRRPNVHGLGLEATSATLDERGMPSFDVRTGQIEDLPIFIAGDATGERTLLHEAADEGQQAGANAATWPHVRARTRRTGLGVMFTAPNIAIVGDGWSSLDPDTVAVGEVSFDNQGRSRVMGENAGIARLYATRRCGYLVGAELLGPRVEHIAHLLAWAVQSRMTVEQALQMPFYHPVVEEGIRTALRDLAESLRIAELPCEGDDMRDGPGA